MPPNVHHWETRINAMGQKERVPIPFDCACGRPANYGKNNRWLCAFCWQRERAFAESVVTL